MALRLKRRLYGLKQSPLNFFKKLKHALENTGLKQSTNDHCLFIGKDVICVCYVDDCLFYSKEPSAIYHVLQSLQDPKGEDHLELNVESDVAGFLGILMQKRPDGTIELLQTGLIDRILRVTEMEDSAPKSTPATPTPTPLGADKDGPSCQENWSYASVVGMLMYLASYSRPDIAFAVHQCARFTHNPRASYEIAIKRIVRYLKGTRYR